MLTEEANARTFLELAQIKEHAQGLDLEAELVAAGEEVPINLLIVGFEADHAGRECIGQISFVPTPDDQLEALKLLQVYVPYPFEVDPNLRGEVGRLLGRLNSRLPLGSLAVADDWEVCFKLVHALPKSEPMEEGVAQELLKLIQFTVAMNAIAIEFVATGQQPCDEVLTLMGYE